MKYLIAVILQSFALLAVFSAVAVCQTCHVASNNKDVTCSDGTSYRVGPSGSYIYDSNGGTTYVHQNGRDFDLPDGRTGRVSPDGRQVDLSDGTHADIVGHDIYWQGKKSAPLPSAILMPHAEEQKAEPEAKQDNSTSVTLDSKPAHNTPVALPSPALMVGQNEDALARLKTDISQSLGITETGTVIGSSCHDISILAIHIGEVA